MRRDIEIPLQAAGFVEHLQMIVKQSPTATLRVEEGKYRFLVDKLSYDADNNAVVIEVITNY